MVTDAHVSDALAQRLSDSGLRSTPQREVIYNVLMKRRDHPTAEEVFARAKPEMPMLSMATVYNCLETMVGNGLVKAVHVDREPTRFCANLREHGHFHCTSCGHVSDIDFSPSRGKGWKLPPGFLVTQHDVTLRGLCAGCASSPEGQSRPQPQPSTK